MAQAQPQPITAQDMMQLDAEAAAKLVTVAADVALVMSDSPAAVIRDVALGSDELDADVAARWVGKSWADIVTPESIPKVQQLLKEASVKGVPRWRQVNHRLSAGADLPVRGNHHGQIIRVRTIVGA